MCQAEFALEEERAAKTRALQEAEERRAKAAEEARAAAQAQAEHDRAQAEREQQVCFAQGLFLLSTSPPNFLLFSSLFVSVLLSRR